MVSLAARSMQGYNVVPIDFVQTVAILDRWAMENGSVGRGGRWRPISNRSAYVVSSKFAGRRQGLAKSILVQRLPSRVSVV